MSGDGSRTIVANSVALSRRGACGRARPMSARFSKISAGAHSRREAMATGRRRGRVGGVVVVDTRRKTEGGGGWVPWVEERARVPSGGLWLSVRTGFGASGGASGASSLGRSASRLCGEAGLSAKTPQKHSPYAKPKRSSTCNFPASQVCSLELRLGPPVYVALRGSCGWRCQARRYCGRAS